MPKKTKGNLLESLLRYEIILALFTLIGVYYFLTFSPVRMPRQTISSAIIELPSAPPGTGKKIDVIASQVKINKPESLPPADNNNDKAPMTKLLTALQQPLATGTIKNPRTAPGKPPIAKTTGAIKATAASNKTTPVTTQAWNLVATQPLPEKMKKQPPPVAKTVKSPVIQLSRKEAAKTTPVTPATATATKQKQVTAQQPAIRQPAKTKQTEIHQTTTAKPRGKSYVIQVGIFIFPDTLKHYQQILQNHGYASFVTTRKRQLPMHRIFLGPYSDMETARKVTKTINKWGDNPFPYRHGKQFYVNVGSFYYQTTAKEKISQYRSRGFAPVDFHEPVKVPHYILLVDGFSFDHYPRKALSSIRQLGISDAFVRNRRP